MRLYCSLALSLLFVACSASSTTTDASPSDGAAQDGALLDASDSGAIADADTGPATTPGSIQVTIDGTAYTFSLQARAAQTANGWMVQAASNDGAKSFGLIFTEAVGDAGLQYGTPTAGQYACEPGKQAPFKWVRFVWNDLFGQGNYSETQSASCAATLTEFGAVGGNVRGSFANVPLTKVAGSGPTTVTVSGSFNVVRSN